MHFFGFRKFYDSYYEALNLRFYKDYKEPQKNSEKEEQEERVNTIPETDKSIETDTEAVQEKTTETKDEEKVTEAPSVEELIIDIKIGILPKDKKSEITVEKQSEKSNTQQDDNKEVVSDITSQYQKIIEQALDKQIEVKLADIAKMIVAKTGNKVQNGIVENVAKQMKGIEIIKIGQAKGVRRTVGSLFNEQ